MRALVTVVLLLLLFVGGFLFWRSAGESDAPPAPDAPAADRSPERRGDAARAPDRAATSREGAAARFEPEPGPDAGGQATDAEPEPEVAAGGDADTPPVTVVLDVRTAVTSAPVAAFRWRFDAAGSAKAISGEGADGAASLTLPPGARGLLLVEADGMQPFTRQNVAVPTPPAPALQVPVVLAPTAEAEGITLVVRDLDRQPVQHVLVSAFALQPGQPEAGWQLGRAMWTRRADADDGVYRLPPLTPGSYGVRLRGTDENGALLPLQPFLRTFTLSGSNGFLEDVQLEPGCALRLELLEPNGQPFSPDERRAATGAGEIRLTLTPPGQDAARRLWAVDQGGGVVQEVDAVPGPGTVHLVEPVPPGAWLLELRIGDTPYVSRTLQLLPQVQTERITVP